ncbi:MAG: DUF983 domain-containing protein [Flavobacterium sp.]
MLKKGSKLYSILTGTCPKCQNESMYSDPNLLHVQNSLKMNEKCSHCGFKYQIEPGFFFGAMYVSYGLNVAVGIAAFIVAYYISESLKVAFISIIVTLLVLFPIIMRMSRSMYINMFVNYEGEQKEVH